MIEDEELMENTAIEGHSSPVSRLRSVEEFESCLIGIPHLPPINIFNLFIGLLIFGRC